MSIHFVDTKFDKLVKRGPFKSHGKLTNTTNVLKAHVAVFDKNSTVIVSCPDKLTAEAVAKALNAYLLGLHEEAE